MNHFFEHPILVAFVTGIGTFFSQFAEFYISEDTRVTLGPTIAVMCSAVIIGMWLKGMSDDIKYIKRELDKLPCNTCPMKGKNENDTD